MSINEALYLHNQSPDYLARMEAKRDPEVILRTDEIDQEIFHLMQEKEKIVERKAKELLPKYEETVKEALDLIGQALSFEREQCWYPRE